MPTVTFRGLPTRGGHPRYGAVTEPVAGYVCWFKDTGPKWQDSARTTPVAVTTDPIGAWDDTSGNGHHLLQATAGKRPLHTTAQINGKDVVRTDGTDDYLKCSAFTLNQPWTIYCCCKPLRTNNTQTFWDGNTDLLGWAGEIDIDAFNASQVYNGYIGQRASSPYTKGMLYWPGVNWTPGGIAPNPVILSACYNGASSSVSVNEALRFTTSPGTANAAGFTLSIRGDNVTLPTKTDFAEILIYASTMTAAQHAQNIAYLNQKYDIYVKGIGADSAELIVHNNSLAYGSSANSPGPYPGTTSWPSVLQRTLGVPLRVANLGQPGQTSTFLLANEVYQVERFYDAGARKKFALFHEGVNECAHVSTNPTLAYGKLASWVTAVKAKGYTAIVMTALRSTNGVLNPNAPNNANNYWEAAFPTVGFQYNYNVLVLANTAGADLVIDAAATTELLDPTSATYFDVDHLHLKDAGYAALAATVKAALLPIMY